VRRRREDYPRGMRGRSLVVSLWLLAPGCERAGAETCPQGQVERRAAASSASAWVEATAPRDVALLQASARVVLAGDRQAVIRPLFRAQIVGFHVQAGDRVKAGDPVVDVIMPEVVAAAANYRGAQLRGEMQGARRDKLRGLRDEGLIPESAVFDVTSRAAETEQEVLSAAATLRAAGIDPAHAKDRLRSPRMSLRSPIDGVVRELGGQLGEVVEGQGTPVARIVGEGAPRVEARFLHPPPEGCTMRFVAVDGAVWPLQRTPLARVVEADDGAVVLWFAAADQRVAFAGLRGAVECVSDDPAVVQVPSAAIDRAADGLVVIVQKAGAAVPVPVTLLISSGASALVRAQDGEGLRAGMRVAEDARALARTQAREETP
jgi:cobalt-zinc-cadmium efflux system membrane fusion protein